MNYLTQIILYALFCNCDAGKCCFAFAICLKYGTYFMQCPLSLRSSENKLSAVCCEVFNTLFSCRLSYTNAVKSLTTAANLIIRHATLPRFSDFFF